MSLAFLPSAHSAQEVPVPRVQGNLTKDAVSVINNAGLEAKVLKDWVTTDPRQYDRVYKQEPDWEKSLPPGSTVVIHVMKYPGEVDKITVMPKVENLPLPEARQRLQKAGLGEVVIGYWDGNDEKTHDKVLLQNPAAAYRVLKNTKVELLVYKYNPNVPKKVLMPSLIGRPVEQASKTLTDMGLKVRIHSSKRVTHDKEKDGTVASQSPPIRAQILTGKQAVLYVYQYQPPPKMVEVPDVNGKTLKEAQDLLAKAGLRGQPQTFRPDRPGSPMDGAVTRQIPGPGQKVTEGSLVRLVLDSQRSRVLPGLRTDKWVYRPGEIIRAEYAMPAEWLAGARVSLLPAGPDAKGHPDRNGRVIASRPLTGRSQGSLGFKAPDRPGDYRLRLYTGVSGQREVASILIKVAIP